MSESEKQKEKKIEKQKSYAQFITSFLSFLVHSFMKNWIKVNCEKERKNSRRREKREKFKFGSRVASIARSAEERRDRNDEKINEILVKTISPSINVLVVSAVVR